MTAVDRLRRKEAPEWAGAQAAIAQRRWNREERAGARGVAS